MVLAQSKITAQGQISVPAEVRRRLGIGPGSILEWTEEGETVVVRRAGRYTSEDIHKKIFTRKPAKKDLTDLKEGIKNYMRKKYAQR